MTSIFHADVPNQRVCPHETYVMKLFVAARKRGFTLLELLITLAILVVVAGIAYVAYNGYIETARISNAIKQINVMSLIISDYKTDKGQFPDSLQDVGLDTMEDPWGHPYRYLNIETAKGLGKVRKDHNLVPLNTDYDLYSTGKDGASVSPLTAPVSHDDIVRANNGGYVGLASGY